MTAVKEALDHIHEVAPPGTEYFDPYRPFYEALLGELRVLGGKPAMRELVVWVTDRTREDGQLPEPSSVRTQARVVCAERDLAVPEESPLAKGSPSTRDTVVREEPFGVSKQPGTGQRTPDGDRTDRSGTVSGAEPAGRSGSTESSGETEQGYTDDGRVAAVVYDRMETFEPYTATELADPLGLRRDRVETLLEQLSSEGRVRQRSGRTGERVWVRAPPARSCPECGGEFGVEFHDPVFGRAGFCPRCGAEL